MKVINYKQAGFTSEDKNTILENQEIRICSNCGILLGLSPEDDLGYDTIGIYLQSEGYWYLCEDCFYEKIERYEDRYEAYKSMYDSDIAYYTEFYANQYFTPAQLYILKKALAYEIEHKCNISWLDKGEFVDVSNYMDCYLDEDEEEGEEEWYD